MIAKCSELIVDWLISTNEVDGEDRELYQYAIYSFFLTLSPVGLAVIIGGITGCLTESIGIILPFMFIRKFSGGYHAKHSGICFVCSTLLLLVCTKISMHESCDRYLFVLTFFATVILVTFSPIDHENRRLDREERQRYKKVVCLLVFLFWCVLIGSFLLHHEKVAVCIAVGIILSAVLQVPCILGGIRNRQHNKNDQK